MESHPEYLEFLGIENIEAANSSIDAITKALEGMKLDGCQVIIGAKNDEWEITITNSETFEDVKIVKMEKRGDTVKTYHFESFTECMMHEMSRMGKNLPPEICPRDGESPEEFKDRVEKWMKENEVDIPPRKTPESYTYDGLG